MREKRDGRDLDTPPKEWGKLILQHDEHLARLRLLWRRGSRAYLPLIPLEDCPEDIKLLTDWSSWESSETDETHLEWKFNHRAGADKRAQAITDRVHVLWKVAVEWTRVHGPKCDFSLTGYGHNGEIWFECGKRCIVDNPAPHQLEPAPYDSGRSPGAIEIVVGDLVLRVWDADALRTVMDTLTG